MAAQWLKKSARRDGAHGRAGRRKRARTSLDIDGDEAAPGSPAAAGVRSAIEPGDDGSVRASAASAASSDASDESESAGERATIAAAAVARVMGLQQEKARLQLRIEASATPNPSRRPYLSASSAWSMASSLPLNDDA